MPGVRVDSDGWFVVVCRPLAGQRLHPDDLAAGFGIGTTTAFRYIRKAIGVLAAAARSWTCHGVDVGAALATQPGPGERATAMFTSWKILRKIRCCPQRTSALVNAHVTSQWRGGTRGSTRQPAPSRLDLIAGGRTGCW
ncbi:hypothetical protein SAMN05216207_102432 [Pseudonocardia ammonioxydans]|uniref:Helix-turn-helix of DDE superfamily endonuclease n=1 Tax=Pseudonocardia ammonioxydans TaxID=260086 RepID=A0A1I5CV09_PSUAM|nr:hypothetical protein SAMN05216207_102432 [Pseudonocardia ammonioxydans]